MGTHKLLLSLGRETVIQKLLRELDADFVTRIVLVARKGDEALAAHVSELKLELVQPDVDPPDMKQSVQVALEWIREHEQPGASDSWMLIPADHPVLKREALDYLYAAWSQSQAEVMIPTFEGRKGHPTFFRWSIAEKVKALAEDEGINALWKRHGVKPELCECNFPEILIDLDTPQDFEMVKQKFSEDLDQ